MKRTSHRNLNENKLKFTSNTCSSRKLFVQASSRYSQGKENGINTTEANSLLSLVKYLETILVNQPALQKILKRSDELIPKFERAFALKKNRKEMHILPEWSAITVNVKIISI